MKIQFIKLEYIYKDLQGNIVDVTPEEKLRNAIFETPLSSYFTVDVKETLDYEVIVHTKLQFAKLYYDIQDYNGKIIIQ